MLGATDDANLPYFAGREGELCRRNLIQEWEETAEASQGGVDAVKFQALQGKHKVNLIMASSTPACSGTLISCLLCTRHRVVYYIEELVDRM